MLELAGLSSTRQGLPRGGGRPERLVACGTGVHASRPLSSACAAALSTIRSLLVDKLWKSCPRADHLVSMNNEPVESIIYGSRYSAGRLSLVGRWIRAKEDPDIRVVRDRFEAYVRAGTVVTVAGVAVEDPAYENPADPLTPL